MKRTPAQVLMGLHLKELGFENIVYEHQFNPDRKWRADIALLDDRILIECDGLFRGGHRRWGSLEEDYERNNWAALNDWRCLRWTNKQILRGEAKAWLASWLLSEVCK